MYIVDITRKEKNNYESGAHGWTAFCHRTILATGLGGKYGGQSDL